MSETYDLIMAAYREAAAAGKDFDALVQLVEDKRIRSEGVLLVEHDEEGNVTVRQTGDHLGRKGLGWGGGVGLVVGLFSPALLGSVVVGAAAGGLIGKFAEHKVASGMEHGLGDQLAPGTAAVIAMVDDADRLAAERALAGTPARSVVALDKKGVRGLKDALAEAALKFVPDRTVLPIPDKAFGGTQGRTLDESAGDWTMLAGTAAPEGAPNVLLIVIDDAGFGNAGTFGGPIATPTMTRVREMGVAYNRFHVTALCSPTRASMLTGRNPHRVGFGTLCELAGPFPGYTTVRPRSCAALPRILGENGYVTGGFGKWHITPSRELGAAGPFDHWPTGWGFDHFWGFLPAASGQYDPIVVQDNTVVGVPEGEDGSQYYFPDDLTDQAVGWLHAVRAQDPHKPWFLYYATGCSHAPHHVAQEWADKYKGRFDEGWDKLR
jgi:arylsulfatase